MSNPRTVPMLLLASLMISCSGPRPQTDADIIVVGAGIAGLAAALDAGRAGTNVLVLDANSVGGGHAVKAGGFALVGTELQAKRGHSDTPDIAFADLMAWGEDADPEWVRQYVELSDRDIHDWLTAMGVKFNILIGTPESQVPRFHFAGGRAVKAVVPMMQNALRMPNIRFLWNTQATGLLIDDQAVTGVITENLRSGALTEFRAAAVILATGGFQSEMAMVRQNWRSDRPFPDRLLIGSGQFASGDGYRLAEQAGAAFVRMDHQVTFINGLPDPRTSDGSRALVTQNPAAIWVNTDGRRFVNEAASSKVAEAAVFRQEPTTYWLIFDDAGKRQLNIRDAPWLNPASVNAEILANPDVTKTALDLESLAEAAGLPAQALITAVTRFNAQIESGDDWDFQRFGSGIGDEMPAPISQAPFYAMQLFPTTRKSMGGPVIDLNGHVLNTKGRLIPGLYAAGELTGVAGINGSHGGSGTFLGPSLLTGRIAGRTAAADLGLETPSQAINEPAGETPTTVVELGRDALQALIDARRPGYWHFEVSHTLAIERAYECGQCHDADSTMTPAISAAQMLARLDTCMTCH